MRVIMGMQGVIWIFFLLLAWRDYSVSFRTALFFPALLLIAAIPWPTRIEEPLTRALMSGVTGFAVEALHLGGFVAHREGEVIVFPNAIVGVSEACSGIRSLQAALVFSLILGEWRRGSWGKRVELVGIGFGLALVGNLLRTFVLCWLASQKGMEVMERYHDRSGFALLVFLVGGIGAWSLWRIPPPLRKESAGRFWIHFKHQASRGMSRVLVAGVILGCGMNFFVDRQIRRSEWNGGASVVWNRAPSDRVVSIPSEVWRNLRASSGEWVESRLKDWERGRLEYYHFHWETIRDSEGVRLHRPDWCMKGIGWKRMREPVQGELQTQNGVIQGYWIEYRRPGEEALQFWTLLRNGKRLEIDFSAPALVEDFSWKNFLFPHEPSSSWEMVSVAVSSPLIRPERKQMEEVTKERLRSVR
jgi:exosortase